LSFDRTMIEITLLIYESTPLRSVQNYLKVVKVKVTSHKIVIK
jgi:hypothetical protein